MIDVPVVMLAGWAHDGSEFEKLAGALPQREICVRVETNAYEGFLPAEGVVDLVGWSLGGMIALELAKRFPTRVRRLVVFSGAASFVERSDYSAGMSPARVRALSKKLESERADALADFYTLCGVESRAELIRCVTAAEELSIEALQTGLRYLRETDLREGLSQVVAPTLLVHGGRDQVIPPTAAQYLAEQIPQAELLLLSRGTHRIPEALSLEELEHVASFLNS